MKIIGITGTLGAGKGTVVDYLVKNKGFIHYSVRDFLIKEINVRKLPVNRDSMVIVANDLRKTFSPSYIIEQLYNQAVENKQDCVIESLRAVGEVELLKQKPYFILFAVDADPLIRYQRIQFRQSETDHISFEEFIENEKREMNSDDPTKQNIAKCIEMADHKFINNNYIKELYDTIEKTLLSEFKEQ